MDERRTVSVDEEKHGVSATGFKCCVSVSQDTKTQRLLCREFFGQGVPDWGQPSGCPLFLSCRFVASGKLGHIPVIVVPNDFWIVERKLGKMKKSYSILWSIK